MSYGLGLAVLAPVSFWRASREREATSSYAQDARRGPEGRIPGRTLAGRDSSLEKVLPGFGFGGSF